MIGGWQLRGQLSIIGFPIGNEGKHMHMPAKISDVDSILYPDWLRTILPMLAITNRLCELGTNTW